MVFALDDALRPAAAGVAAALRAGGRKVELVLGPRKMKWVLKRCAAAGAARLLLLGGDEWAAGRVRVKTLATFEEADVPLEALLPAAAAGAGAGAGAH